MMVIGSITFVIVLLLLLVLLAVLARRQRGLKPRLPAHPIRLTPSAQLQKLQASGDYRGVKIDSHCRRSAHLVGREYEFDTAPALPVRDCEHAVCECGYVGLAERRKATDRRTWTDRRSTVRLDSDDRRAKRPRRKADLATWAAHGNL